MVLLSFIQLPFYGPHPTTDICAPVSCLGPIKARGPHDGPSLQPSFFDQPHSFSSFSVANTITCGSLASTPPTRRRSPRDQPFTSFAHRTAHLTSRRRRHATTKRPSRRKRQLYPTDSILHRHKSHAPRRHCTARPYIRCAR